LSYDEKPLLLFQKLKDAKKNPVFMLKHIKDIRSPIAVAHQKQAARKASETPSSGQSRSGSSADRPSLRPPLLQAQGAIPGANGQQLGHSQQGVLAGGNRKSGWPEAMSPAIDNKDRSEDPSSSTPPFTSASDHQESSGPVVNVKEPMPSGTGTLSYAVAIYPYMAEQEDEFDVIVYDLDLWCMSAYFLTINLLTAVIRLSLYQGRGVGGLCRGIPKVAG
jgi:protein STE50